MAVFRNGSPTYFEEDPAWGFLNRGCDMQAHRNTKRNFMLHRISIMYLESISHVSFRIFFKLTTKDRCLGTRSQIDAVFSQTNFGKHRQTLVKE